ncbi:long-chain acyl-CoA synthetase [Amycolatopsis sulphurea]|uniref:Long-chain acyl-CoA synthetase n=1 Tax=Amycolatopsis sulphurea TaxID=76022 RepID=A0A2A9F8Q7_9PSEU|nr:long-chain fatty acid--CoA ligase [Amycolatopsis sulphurea]PFG47186.1 long-chain acyl-CoA synthetase [Amycolatopsis sulphurea]
MLNLSMMLTDSARRLPGKVAVRQGCRSMTYREVDQRANQVANLLRDRGIQPGDRVAITCPNVLEFPPVYFGILKAGAVVVPLNTMLKRPEVAYHLSDSGARAYFCVIGDAEAWRGFADTPACEHLVVIDTPGGVLPDGVPTLSDVLQDQPAEDVLVPTEATDTAVILYTSGTTGKPKGAELTHANLVLNAMATLPLFEARQDDVHLVTLPLFHSFGQTVQLNAGFAAGSSLVLLPRFDPRAALQEIVTRGVTFFAGVPTMYWALLSAAESGGAGSGTDLAAVLRVAVSGGAALPVEVLTRFQEVFGVGIREGYGLSETSPTVTFNRLDRAGRPGSIGLPIWGMELRLVDQDWHEVPAGQPGEIAVRGHSVMKGYLGRPEATAEVLRDGWFRTGDIATRDEDGFYFIVDRAKDLIVRGGFNVYPREIEETLMSHPAVSLVAVIGVPDERAGEEVKAFVIRRPGATITGEELIGWCREHLAVYKAPRLVEFRDALPMNSTGKLLKRELR